MLEKATLSKSTFIRGLQCSKSLYLYKHFYQQRDLPDSTKQAIFSRGNAVGSLAQKLFPGGQYAAKPDNFNYADAVAKTKELIQKGENILYEAAFLFDGVYCALDILVKTNDTWIAYEVKSSAKITSTHKLDAAIQYYVISNNEIEIHDFQLLYINTAYVRKGKLDLNQLFSKKSVLHEIQSQQDFIASKVSELKLVIEQTELPQIAPGEHCHIPYTCDFIGTCRGALAEDSIFYLNGLSKQNQYELFLSGIKNIGQLAPNFSFTLEQKIQYDCAVNNRIHVDKQQILKFLSTLKYPFIFLDFEFFMPAVPAYENTSPYEHLPFLYSIHSKSSPHSTCTHRYFLAETGVQPFESFIVQLIADTATEGDIIVFDATHEKRILSKAMNLFPERKNALQKIVNRMKDLSEPFQKKYFYCTPMKGSYSMKSLLPAIAPDLNFEQLEIKNGIAALAAFENLQVETDMFKALETRQKLIEYCKMDTLGLVKIVEALEKAVLPV
ncbi:MAG: DUF2779 domain-containing protein [Bacteroidetes bacterium]|nr:DUF2779 domain-containing protein [Bacteroidota bacterium]MBK9800516.1 DUF2779 domain-containing protein [Bacteroidota bacterium]MBP6413619.1 DUF2779 domain-containing protein [Bacteroidia bacterium]